MKGRELLKGGPGRALGVVSLRQDGSSGRRAAARRLDGPADLEKPTKNRPVGQGRTPAGRVVVYIFPALIKI